MLNRFDQQWADLSRFGNQICFSTKPLPGSLRSAWDEEERVRISQRDPRSSQSMYNWERLFYCFSLHRRPSRAQKTTVKRFLTSTGPWRCVIPLFRMKWTRFVSSQHRNKINIPNYKNNIKLLLKRMTNWMQKQLPWRKRFLRYMYVLCSWKRRF